MALTNAKPRLHKKPAKKQTLFPSIRKIQTAKQGVLERVEDDDTRDHQKAANLVMRSEICDERKFQMVQSDGDAIVLKTI
jgi:hypothetical protein